MASLLGTAYVAIKAELGQLRTGLRDAENLTERTADSMERGFKRVHSAVFSLKGALAGLGLGMLAREALQYADSWTLVEGRLRLVTTSSNELKRVQEDLFRISQNARVGYEATADLYARMARATKNLSVEQKSVLSVTEAISKALTISGASAESANAALFQLSQGLAANALRGQELNSVLEQTPRVAEAIADGLDMGLGALREFAAQGKLTAETVINAIESQSKVIDKEFRQMPKTVGQAWTQIQNSTLRAIGYMDDAGNASGELADAISNVANEIDDWITSNDDLLKQSLPEYIDKIKISVKGILDIYNLLPEGVVGPGSMGLVGAILFGSLKKGAVTALLATMAEAFGTLAVRAKYAVEQYEGSFAQATEEIEAQRKMVERLQSQIDEFQGNENSPIYKALVKQFEDANEKLNELKDNLFAPPEGIGAPLEALSEAAGKASEKIEDAAKNTNALNDNLKETEREAKRVESALKSFFGSLDDYNRFDVRNEMENARVDSALEKEFDFLYRYAEEYEESVKEASDRSNEYIRDEWNRLLDSIQDSTADIFFEFFQDIDEGWKNLWDTAKNYFLRILSEIVAAAATQKIVVPILTQVVGAPGAGVPGQGGLNFSGGGLGNLFGTPLFGGEIEAGTGMAAQGTGVTLGNLMMAGGLGSLGYSLLGDLVGLPQGEYSSLGAGLFSAGGFALGGPIGAVIGSIVGGILGSLIGGNKKRSYAGAAYDLSPDGEDFFSVEQRGRFSRRISGEAANEIDRVIEEGIQSVLDTYQDIYKILDEKYQKQIMEKLEGFDFSVYARSHHEDELMEEFERALENEMTELSEYLASVFKQVLNMDFLRENFDLSIVAPDSAVGKSIANLKNFQGSDAEYLQVMGEAIMALEQMSDVWDSISTQAERMISPLSAYESQMEQVRLQFEGWIATMEALGFAMRKINEVRSLQAQTEAVLAMEEYIRLLKEEQAALQGAVNAAKNEYMSALNRELSKWKSRKAELEADVKRWETIIESFEKTLDSFLYGPKSFLAPDEQMAKAEAEFWKAYQQAMSGDESAVEKLDELASTYLGAAQGAIADQAEFQSIFGEVSGALSEIKAIYEGAKESVETINMRNLEKAIELYENELSLLQEEKPLSVARTEYLKLMNQLAHAQYDKQIKNWQAQLDAVRGIGTTLTTIESVLMDIEESLRKYWGGGFSGGGIATGPMGGHVELLHGDEAVIPLEKGDVPVVVKEPKGEKETAQLLASLLYEARDNKRIQKETYRILDRISGGQNSFLTRTS